LFVKKQFSTKKQDYYITKIFDDKVVTFTTQSGFKSYIKRNFNIEVFRHPDEAYIIEYKGCKKVVIKILEKKRQETQGTTETKL